MKFDKREKLIVEGLRLATQEATTVASESYCRHHDCSLMTSWGCISDSGCSSPEGVIDFDFAKDAKFFEHVPTSERQDFGVYKGEARHCPNDDKVCWENTCECCPNSLNHSYTDHTCARCGKTSCWDCGRKFIADGYHSFSTCPYCGEREYDNWRAPSGATRFSFSGTERECGNIYPHEPHAIGSYIGGAGIEAEELQDYCLGKEGHGLYIRVTLNWKGDPDSCSEARGWWVEEY